MDWLDIKAGFLACSQFTDIKQINYYLNKKVVSYRTVE